MIVFLLMNFIVGTSAFLLTFRVFKLRCLIDSIISLFILYFAQIVFTQTLLGIMGMLYIQNVIFLNLAILLIIWVATRKRPLLLSIAETKNTAISLLNNKVVLFTLSVIMAFGLIKAFINLISPPFGWDCLNYHFSFPVEWLKNGNLNNPITISGDPSPSYYPMNGSLFFLWLILPFKNVFLADWGQFPFFILAIFATYNIARKDGLSKEYSFYAASMFLLIPNFFKQLEIAYVDVIVAALFLTCLNYLFAFSGSSSFYSFPRGHPEVQSDEEPKDFSLIKNISLFGITLGLFIGTKTIALPYSILLFLPFAYLCFAQKKNVFRVLPLVIILIIIFGSFTYLRNFVDTGNPLYPLDFKLFGKTIFKGVMDLATYGAHFKAEDRSIPKLLFHEGLGGQSLIFTALPLFLAWPLTFIKRRKTLNFNLVYFLLLPFLIYFIYYFIIPLANVRYLYSLLAIGMIIGFYVADILRIPKRIVGFLVVICVLSSIPDLASNRELIVSLASTFLIFALALLWKKKSAEKKLRLNPLAASLLVVLLITIFAFLEKDYVKNEFLRYIKMQDYSGFWPDATKAWDWLNKETTGNNIAYTGRSILFPLYGTHFKNNVDYVSVNKIEPAKLHYFRNSRYSWGANFKELHENLQKNENYRGEANYENWLKNLKRQKTDYLFVYSLDQIKDIIFPLEDVWAKNHPDKFLDVFSNRTIHIYKVMK